MKTKFLTICLIISSFLLPSNLYAEWELVAGGEGKTKIYVDVETIKKDGNYVYYWELRDFTKPSSAGALSGMTYYECDCGKLRYKMLTSNFYNKPMAKGKSENYSWEDSTWYYPSPKSVNEYVLKQVCEYAKDKFK